MRDDRAGPEDRFDPQQLCPCGPVAEHLETTGVGRDGAADRRTVAASQVDPVGPPGRTRHRLDLGHGRAGFGGELPPDLIHVEDPGQPGQAQDSLPVERHPAPDQAGVPALGHQGHPGVAAQGHDGSDLGHITGPDDGRRGAPEASCPVRHVGTHHLTVLEDVAVPDHLAQLPQQPGIESRGRSLCRVDPAIMSGERTTRPRGRRSRPPAF